MVSDIENEEGKKKELLEIGLRIFLENGMTNFSIRNLVKEADISIGLFYYYFDSKEDFILNCVEIYNKEYIEELSAIINNRDLDVMDRIDLAMNNYAEQFSKLFRIDDESGIGKSNRTMIENLLVEKTQPLLENLIQEGLDSGVFKILNAKITSTFLVSGLVGILIKVNLTNEKHLIEETQRLIYSILAIEWTHLKL